MKNILKKIDIPLLIAVIIMMAFGLIMIFSASNVASSLEYSKPSYYFARKQLIFLILGSITSFILLFIPSKTYNIVSRLGMVGVIILMLLLKSYGVVTNSAKSWFSIMNVSVQPSEFAKTFIILYLACWYSERKKFKKWWHIFIPIGISAIACIFVALEPDLGTALIIFFIVMLIFYFIPFKGFKWLRIFKICGVLLIAAGFAIISIKPDILTDSQANRLNYKRPCDRYLSDTGYQVCNGYIAMNNGGALGVGLGNSTQKYLYLPESYSDMIYPIIVEELGLIGGGLVLVMYLFILYRILAIGRNATNLKGSIIAFGTFAYLLVHITINLGGVLGLIPLTGVPLPFLSYGGSFIINLMILLGLCGRVSYESKVARYKREVKAALK